MRLFSVLFSFILFSFLFHVGCSKRSHAIIPAFAGVTHDKLVEQKAKRAPGFKFQVAFGTVL